MSDARLALGQQAYRYFLERGLPPHQAAAIAGNMAWEGAGRTDLVNPNDNLRNEPAAPHSFGISQWNGNRLRGLIDYARSQGKEIPAGDLRDVNYLRSIAPQLDLQTQLGHTWNEMQGPEARALAGIKGGTDLRSATAGAISYHRPAGWSWGNPMAGHGFEGRYRLADTIMRAGAGEAPPAAPAYTDDLTKAPISVAGAPPPAAVPMAPPASERPPSSAPAAPASFLDAVVPDLSKTLAGLLGGGGDKAAPTTGDQTDAKIAKALERERERNAPQEDVAAMEQIAPLALAPRRARGLQMADAQQQMRAPMRLGIRR